MLTFITPILLGFSGAIFLKEPISLKGMLSGCRQTFGLLAVIVPHKLPVCSFFGVILIARPQFLFGGPEGNPSEVVMPRERIQSVTYGIILSRMRALIPYYYVVWV